MLFNIDMLIITSQWRYFQICQVFCSLLINRYCMMFLLDTNFLLPFLIILKYHLMISIVLFYNLDFLVMEILSHLQVHWINLQFQPFHLPLYCVKLIYTFAFIFKPCIWYTKIQITCWFKHWIWPKENFPMIINHFPNRSKSNW